MAGRKRSLPVSSAIQSPSTTQFSLDHDYTNRTLAKARGHTPPNHHTHTLTSEDMGDDGKSAKNGPAQKRGRVAEQTHSSVSQPSPVEASDAPPPPSISPKKDQYETHTDDQVPLWMVKTELLGSPEPVPEVLTKTPVIRRSFAGRTLIPKKMDGEETHQVIRKREEKVEETHNRRSSNITRDREAFRRMVLGIPEVAPRTPPPALLRIPRLPRNVSIEDVLENVESVKCDRCEASMRPCVRRMKYSGAYREYPAYRCTKKGCQTFKSLRAVANSPACSLLPDVNTNSAHSTSLTMSMKSRKRRRSIEDDATGTAIIFSKGTAGQEPIENIIIQDILNKYSHQMGGEEEQAMNSLQEKESETSSMEQIKVEPPEEEDDDEAEREEAMKECERAALVNLWEAARTLADINNAQGKGIKDPLEYVGIDQLSPQQVISLFEIAANS